MFTSRIIFVIAAVAFACVAGLSAYAVDTNWIHDPLTPGSWHDPANWDNGLPYFDFWDTGDSNTAYIDNGGTAQITADCLNGPAYVGYDASGHVVQQGGSAEFSGGLFLGYNPGSFGTYDLWAGELNTYCAEQGGEHVGDNGTAVFNHFGGNNYPHGLRVGEDGTYNLYDGSLYATPVEAGGGYGPCEDIEGRFNQYGGTHGSVMDISVGGNGVYNMSGGGLSSVILFLGGGEFNQSGASNVASSELYLYGTYNLAGGSLTAGMIDLGYPGYPGYPGTFNVTSNTAYIAVSGVAWPAGPWIGLTIADGSVWSAVPGTTVHMGGATFGNQTMATPFENQSTNEADLAGLLNTTFVFEGGSEVIDTFEIAGLDMGKTTDGFTGNFAFDGLTLGGADIGYVQLIDGNDNGNRGGAGGEAESLYVKSLILNSGTLDLNNYHLYTLYFENNGGTVLNGEVNVIPEPLSVSLVGLGIFGVVGFLRRGLIAFRRHLAHASKIIALAAAFALLAASAAAYADDFPKLEWVRSSSTLIPWDHTPFKLNAGQSVAFDNGGNIYVTGYYDHGSFDYVEAAMWLNKYDANGNSLWSYNSPWSDYDSRAYDVATDAVGNAYVVGSIYLYPESGEEGPNISVQKFGPSGDIVWTRTYNGEESGWGEARGVAVDSTGNVYIAGYQNGLDEPGQTWLRKYDSNGNWLDAFAPWPIVGAAYDIAVDPSGNVLVTGVFGGGNAIAKYDPLGNVLWTRADGGQGVAVDAAGNVYATGAAYASKYDPDGNLLWTQPLIPPNYDEDYVVNYFVDEGGIAVDADGYVYVVGTAEWYYEYYGLRSCDSRIWLQMYNANGIPIAEAFYGSNNVPFQPNEGYGVAVDPNAKYYCVTGYIDPYDWGIYGTDMVVLKYNVAPEPATLALIAPALLGFAGIAFRRMRKG